MSNAFGWCFVGSGSIAHKVAADTEDIRVVSVCSRRRENAERFAAEYGGAAYDTLEEAVNAPGVEGVYVNMQHPEHHDCVLRAIASGKPVLCEKPLAVNARQVREMIESAQKKQVFLAEAMWTRFNPVIKKVQRWIADGEIGEVHYSTADFAGSMPFDAESRLFSLERAGGALLDIGVYPLSLAQMIFGEKPLSFHCNAALTQGVDMRLSLLLEYKGNRTAAIFTALDTVTNSTAMIYGSKGYVRIPDFWEAREATLMKNTGETERFTREGCIGWGYQMRDVAAYIRKGHLEATEVPHSHSLSLAETMDDIRARIGVAYPADNA